MSSALALPVTFFGSLILGYVLGKNNKIDTSSSLEENYSWLMNQVFSYINPLLNSLFFLDMKGKKIGENVMKKKIVEVCIDNIESCLMALKGGANSVELCSDRANGGVTPSYGFISECVSRLKSSDVHVHVLIRPRLGDFCYSESEFDVLLRDILSAQALGAQGVVVGVVTADGKVDKERLRVLRTLSRGMILTFHRAFDSCCGSIEEAAESLETVIECGCDRILTSQKSTAYEGREELSNLVTLARGRISVVAAAGITPGNVYEVVTSSHVQGVHAGGSLHSKVWPSLNASSWVPVGTTSASHSNSEAFAWDRVDEDFVRVYVSNAMRAFEETRSVNTLEEQEQRQVQEKEQERGTSSIESTELSASMEEVEAVGDKDESTNFDSHAHDDGDIGDEEDDITVRTSMDSSYVHIDFKKALSSMVGESNEE